MGGKEARIRTRINGENGNIKKSGTGRKADSLSRKGKPTKKAVGSKGDKKYGLKNYGNSLERRGKGA